MGVPPASAKALSNLGAGANAYFPASITVRRGDKVRFVPAGFHDVELPVKGNAATGLIAQGAPIAGDTDAAGAQYWFNGQPDLEYAPSLLTSSFGRTASYDGSRAVRSGLPTANRPKPLTVKFTKSGTFTYYCNVHAGMKGRVSVVSGKAPSAKADAKRVKKQVAAAVKTAKALQTTPVATNTIQVGNGGPGGVEIFAFYPGERTVPVGTVLTFETGRLSLDQHTATTGPGDPLQQPDSFLGRLSDSLAAGHGSIDQAAIYPSDPRGVPALLTPNLHGNGFWNSGFMDSAGATEFGKRLQVKFVAPGTYAFYCIIHPSMKTVVTVS